MKVFTCLYAEIKEKQVIEMYMLQLQIVMKFERRSKRLFVGINVIKNFPDGDEC